MKVIATEAVPIKMWLDEIEEGALQQAKNLANLPFIFRYLVIMPDAHQGYGMPIGGVLATKGVVVPNCVGVDIGCGLCALKTSYRVEDIQNLQGIVDLIKQRIPVGFNHNIEPCDVELMPDIPDFGESKTNPILCKEFKSAQKQLGSLGGGNHFLELQKDKEGYLWIMIHSGSRNLGLKVADYYNKQAVKLNAKYFSKVEPKWDLAFLPIEDDLAKDYFKEMQYCVDFAFANRRLMMDRVIDCIQEVLQPAETIAYSTNMINIAHNYARWENHFGQNVIVHRKGATSAKLGEIGIIPGSMGTQSYIVEGLGNEQSFMSCSHGAGRKMGRKQAQRELNLTDEIEILNHQGILHDMKSTENLDEATGSYKSIKTVMENQRDLVNILIELKPIAVIKG
jgi:tRNA-splicing ligase RtcB